MVGARIIKRMSNVAKAGIVGYKAKLLHNVLTKTDQGLVAHDCDSFGFFVTIIYKIYPPLLLL